MSANRTEPLAEAAGERSLTEGLAAILARPVDPDLHRRAAQHVLDWLGCAVIGATTEPGRLIARYGAGFSSGAAHAIGVGRLDPPAAAFVNGAYGNVLEIRWTRYEQIFANRARIAEGG